MRCDAMLELFSSLPPHVPRGPPCEVQEVGRGGGPRGLPATSRSRPRGRVARVTEDRVGGSARRDVVRHRER